MTMKKYDLYVQNETESLRDIFSLIAEQQYGEVDISIVLKRDDVLELLKLINLKSYDDKYVELDGEFFIVSSIVDMASAFFVEKVEASNGGLKIHEGNILILPSYIPDYIKRHYINCDIYKVVELKQDSVYEELNGIIEDY